MAAGDPVALWGGQEAASPVIAVAVHAGHALRDEVAALTAVPAARRFREEDAGTAEWAARFPTRLVAGRSRFEVDLNRPRGSAVYLQSQDCWDVEPWHRPLPPDVADRSRAVHDAFYSVLGGILDRVKRRSARSSFTTCTATTTAGGRRTPRRPIRPTTRTSTSARDRWTGPGGGRWSTVSWPTSAPSRSHMATGDSTSGRTSASKGRWLAQWVHDRYPETGCALAIEVKKFFMDEQTGQLDDELTDAVGDALAATVPGMIGALGSIRR